MLLAHGEVRVREVVESWNQQLRVLFPVEYDKRAFSFLTFQLARDKPVAKPIPVEMSNWQSIYIPIIPDDMSLSRDGLSDDNNQELDLSSQNSISELLEHVMDIGSVSRVDIVKRTLTNGTTGRSAFVHFDSINENYRGQLNAGGGSMRVTEFSDKDQCVFRFHSTADVTVNRFLTLKINYKPIATVSTEDLAQLNVHQLVAKIITMQATIDEQALRIKEFDDSFVNRCRSEEQSLLRDNLYALHSNETATPFVYEV